MDDDDDVTPARDPSLEIKFALLHQRVKTLESDRAILRAGLSALERDLKRDFKAELARVEKALTTLITRTEFAPVKTLVYSLVGLILAGFVGALAALVFSAPGG